MHGDASSETSDERSLRASFSSRQSPKSAPRPPVGRVGYSVGGVAVPPRRADRAARRAAARQRLGRYAGACHRPAEGLVRPDVRRDRDGRSRVHSLWPGPTAGGGRSVRRSSAPSSRMRAIGPSDPFGTVPPSRAWALDVRRASLAHRLRTGCAVRKQDSYEPRIRSAVRGGGRGRAVRAVRRFYGAVFADARVGRSFSSSSTGALEAPAPNWISTRPFVQTPIGRNDSRSERSNTG
jgi:hypothetical protein